MNYLFRIGLLFVILILLLSPVYVFSWGSLEQIGYKVKGSDGNRWSHLLGRANIVRGNEQKGKITFTFDDGPDHRTTPVLLDELDRYGIKGTFFVNGHRFHPRTAGGKENQAILREVHRRGHFIGNHTFSHKDITTLDEDMWRQEVVQVEQMVQSITGRRPWLFRPPFGRANSDSVTRLGKHQYTVVMWNLDPLDWKATTPGQLLARTQRTIEDNPDGGVFLLHDTNRNTAQAFPLIMEWIEERNADLRAQGKSGLEVVGIEHFIEH